MKIVRRLPDRIMVIIIIPQRTADVKSLSKRPFYHVPLPFRPNPFSPPLSSECLSAFFTRRPFPRHTARGGGVDFTEVLSFFVVFWRTNTVTALFTVGRAPSGTCTAGTFIRIAVAAEFLKFFEFPYARPEATTATNIPSFRTESHAIHYCNGAIF